MRETERRQTEGREGERAVNKRGRRKWVVGDRKKAFSMWEDGEKERRK